MAISNGFAYILDERVINEWSDESKAALFSSFMASICSL